MSAKQDRGQAVAFEVPKSSCTLPLNLTRFHDLWGYSQEI
jgi:hypothetical protein